jgi:hypothetical protein
MLTCSVLYFLRNDIESGQHRNATRGHDASSGKRVDDVVGDDDNGGCDDEERDKRGCDGDGKRMWERRTRGQQAAQNMRITHRQEGPKEGLGTVATATPSGQCHSA